MLKNFSIIILVFCLIAFPSVIYGKKGNGPKEFRGAGIGKEVSEETKILKESEEKENFEKWVRERARERQRIETHKEGTKTKDKSKEKKKKKNKSNTN